MPMYLLDRQKATWQFSPNLSPVGNINVLLTKMAICRQARIDKVSLQLYTEILLQLGDLRAFQAAMAILAESPREDGQTALPSLGDIIAEMEEARERWPTGDNKKINVTPLIAGPEQKRLA